MRYRFDPSVRRSADDRTLMGGSPFRIVSLTETELEEVDRAVGASGNTSGNSAVVDRLCRGGFLQPVTPELSINPALLSLVDVVIPTKARPGAVAALLDQLPIDLVASVTVVDDGSEPPLDLDPMLELGIEAIRRDHSLGPAGARHAGAQTGSARYMLFIDDDIIFGDRVAGDRVVDRIVVFDGIEPTTGAAEVIGRLVALAEAWGLGATAPRIVSQTGRSLLERFEAERGTFDRGDTAGLVMPHGRIPFVPSGLLLVRRDAYEQVGGLCADMLRGEDVDLVWRLHGADWPVWYEPTAIVAHPARSSWRQWLTQRHNYGRSTAELGLRHPDAVDALSISPWSVAVWVLLLSGGRKRVLAGIATWIVSIGLLTPELRDRVDDPVGEAITLAGGGTLFAGEALAAAMRRSWWPIVLAGAVVSPSLRRAAISALVPLALDWRRTKPGLDPIRWSAVAFVDELAYGSGLWHGALATRSLKALSVRWQSMEDLVLPDTDQL